MKSNIKKLIAKYEGLKEEHFIDEGEVQMITRQGIDIIESKEGFHVLVKSEQSGSDFATVSASGWKVGNPSECSPGYTTLASASPLTCRKGQKHYVEIAEARARARVVLRMAGLYKEGIFSEGEIVEQPRPKTPVEQVKDALKPKEKAPSVKMCFVNRPLTDDGVNLFTKLAEVVEEVGEEVRTALHDIPKSHCIVYDTHKHPYLVFPRTSADNSKLLTALTTAGITSLDGTSYTKAPHLFADSKRNPQTFKDLKDFVKKATVENILTLTTVKL